jgi:prepilin-type N-terminal cleavage/methylation domain-containing protein
MRRTPNSSSGFSLIELLISAFIGAMLIAAAAKLYSKGLQISWTTSQRAELQQDFRAASNLLQRDISMAGAGALGQQGIATDSIGLPQGGGATAPVYPCTGMSTCAYINGAAVPYPTNAAVPYLYSIVPGPNQGITVTAAQGPTDIITVNYADITLSLNCYNGTLNAAGTLATFQLPAVQLSTCILPQGVAAPQALNAPIIGLQVGDMILFGNAAVAVVTGAVATCAPTGTNTACYTVPFSVGDPGHINQPTATSGSLKPYESASLPSGVRLISVTYYLAIPPQTGLPTLMRIQSGQLPAPVAENVVYLKFCYDVYSAGVVTTCQSPLPAGTTPANITKVNIVHMSMRSQGRDTWSRSAAATYGGYEGLDLQTSIAARNLTMLQEYPIQCPTPPCL